MLIPLHVIQPGDAFMMRGSAGIMNYPYELGAIAICISNMLDKEFDSSMRWHVFKFLLNCRVHDRILRNTTEINVIVCPRIEAYEI